MKSTRRSTTTEIGKRGEELAAQALRAYGYNIVERNWRCQDGEIDLVARDGDEWVIVEVKTRGGDEYGTPEEAVTEAKQLRLLRLGMTYMEEHGIGDLGWRIDVVAIYLGPAGQVQRLRIHKDAVRANG